MGRCTFSLSITSYLSPLNYIAFYTFTLGSVTIFTKGVDRIATQLEYGMQYFGNAVFGGADFLWEDFMDRIVAYSNNPSNGGSAVKNPSVKFRVNWDNLRDVLLNGRPLPPCR